MHLLPAGDGGPGRAFHRPKGPQNDQSRRSPIWAVVSTRKARYLKAEAHSDAKRCCARFAVGPSFSGGDDQRGRTRVAGATGALAAGAPRPRCRDLRLAALAGFRSAAGSAVEEAQAPPARPHFLYRGPAHPRHYCLIADIGGDRTPIATYEHAIRTSAALTPAECRPRGSP